MSFFNIYFLLFIFFNAHICTSPAGACLLTWALGISQFLSLTPLCQNLHAQLVSSGALRPIEPAKNEHVGSELSTVLPPSLLSFLPPSLLSLPPSLNSALTAVSVVQGGITVAQRRSYSFRMHRVWVRSVMKKKWHASIGWGHFDITLCVAEKKAHWR